MLGIGPMKEGSQLPEPGFDLVSLKSPELEVFPQLGKSFSESENSRLVSGWGFHIFGEEAGSISFSHFHVMDVLLQLRKPAGVEVLPFATGINGKPIGEVHLFDGGGLDRCGILQGEKALKQGQGEEQGEHGEKNTVLG